MSNIWHNAYNDGYLVGRSYNTFDKDVSWENWAEYERGFAQGMQARRNAERD